MRMDSLIFIGRNHILNDEVDKAAKDAATKVINRHSITDLHNLLNPNNVVS